MEQLLNWIYAYGTVGGAVALVFLFWGVERLDAAARQAWLVRPVLAPGVVLLWPLVLGRWIVLEWRRGQDQ